MVSRCFPGGYNVKLYISRGRLAWWLLDFLCCGRQCLVLQIYGVDSGGRYGYARVFVDIIDEDDNAPYFEQNFFNFAVWVQADTGTTAGRLVAEDADTGEKEKYNLFSG